MAAAASRSFLALVEHLKQIVKIPVPTLRMVVLNISEHLVHFVWEGLGDGADRMVDPTGAGFFRFRLGGWFLSIEIAVFHVLENDGVRGEGILEILGVHHFFGYREHSIRVAAVYSFLEGWN